jgi:hypothetical protein
MAERLKAPASKAGVGVTPPGVQIPLSPWTLLGLRVFTERDTYNMRDRVPPLGGSRVKTENRKWKVESRAPRERCRSG